LACPTGTSDYTHSLKLTAIPRGSEAKNFMDRMQFLSLKKSVKALTVKLKENTALIYFNKW